MSNEVLAVGFLFLYMLCALVFYKMGRIWLQSFLIISYVITLCITTKFFSFFGFTASAGLVTYAGIFLATDMLTEKYGKAVGFQTIRISFAVGLVFALMTQINLAFVPVGFAKETSEAMQVVYGSTVRLMIAGFSVYLLAQHFDVWLYHKISEWTKGKHLWLRNIGSTFASQIIDSVLFFTLAFYGTMPNNVFVEVLLVGLTIKVLIALLDTPFIYLSKKIIPLDERAK